MSCCFRIRVLCATTSDISPSARGFKDGARVCRAYTPSTAFSAVWNTQGAKPSRTHPTLVVEGDWKFEI